MTETQRTYLAGATAAVLATGWVVSVMGARVVGSFIIGLALAMSLAVVFVRGK